MNNKELVLETLKRSGRMAAEAVQAKSSAVSGTELNAETDYIPDFRAACAAMNMLTRKAGQEDGFVCKSSAGRVVRLIQNYDSEAFAQEPEELPAQWRFVWSRDPAHALPFVGISTSPYMTGDCCAENGIVYRSREDHNVWPPSARPEGWEQAE